MPVDKTILQIIKENGFYEEKIPTSSAKSTNAYMHRAYAMMPNGMIISYCALVTSENEAPSNFAYMQVNPETGKHEGYCGSYYNKVEGLKKPGLPSVIANHYSQAKKIINSENTLQDRKYHKSLSLEMRCNFGDILHVTAGAQSYYEKGSKVSETTYGKDLSFMIASKNCLMQAQKAYNIMCPKVH